MNKIMVIGNSHANWFTGTEPQKTNVLNTRNNICSISIGPIIAYNFQQNHLPKVMELIKNHDGKVMIAVGEVDCRWHLPKEAEISNRNIEDVVEECLDRFFPCLLQIQNTHPVIGWGNHITLPTKHQDDPQNPVYGNRDRRDVCSICWDEGLKERCLSHNMQYLSINQELMNDREQYFMDYCHLNEKAWDIAKEKFCLL